MPEPFTVLIMAAGQGTRMRSGTPKVLHRVCGKPMVEWVIDAAARPVPRGSCASCGPATASPRGCRTRSTVAEQREGEGTGAAVLAARDHTGEGPVVVLSGDHPLVTPEQIAELVDEHSAQHAGVTLLTTEQLDPAGYGRIVRNGDGDVERIVETKYTEGVPPAELAIREINLGTYVFQAPRLFEALDEVELDERRALPHERPSGAQAGRRPRDRPYRPTTPPSRSASTTASA